MSVQKTAIRRERFSQFLEYLRSDKGFSLSKVAENIGISVQGLYKIKRGESNPSKQTVMLLQIKYGLNPTWYATGRENMLLSLMPERIEHSDEIMLELLRMKNKVIDDLDHKYAILKKENTLLKKELR